MCVRRSLLKSAFAVAVLLPVLGYAGSARARQIHFQGEFTPTGAPAAGWSYLWNASGPLGNSANYVPLVRDSSGNWETVTNSAYPDPAPGNGLRVSSTGMVPGNGSVQAADSVQRYAIVAYTIQASDLAQGANAVMDTYSFSVPVSSADGIDSVIYVNNTQIVSSPLPPGIVYDQNTPGAFPVPLGTLNVGDTIYVATGAGFLPTATDIGDALTMDFKVSLVPEPAALSVLTVAAIALGARVRRRRRL
jgi:hypothetical protein